MTFSLNFVTLLIGGHPDHSSCNKDDLIADLTAKMIQVQNGDAKAKSDLSKIIAKAAQSYAEEFQIPSCYSTEDFSQEVVMTFLKQVDVIKNLPGWFSIVCVRIRSQYFKQNPEGFQNSLETFRPSELKDNSLESSVFSIIEFECLLRGLSDVQKKIVTLRFLDDLPHEQIAQNLEKSEGAVRMQLKRAKEKLRKDIELIYGENIANEINAT